MSLRHVAVLVRHALNKLIGRRTRRTSSVVTLSLVFVAVSLASIPINPDKAAAVEIAPACTTVDLTELGRLLSPKVGTSDVREERTRKEETQTVDVDELNGDYEIILISRDDLHGDDDQQDQANEQWYLEGLNENGDVVMESEPTGDLPNAVKSKPFNVGTETFEGVVKLRARHAQQGDGIDSIQPDRVILRNETCTTNEDDQGGENFNRYELLVKGTRLCIGIEPGAVARTQVCAGSDNPDLESSTTYFEEIPVGDKYLLRSVLTGTCLAVPGSDPIIAFEEVECDPENQELLLSHVGDRIVEFSGRCLHVNAKQSDDVLRLGDSVTARKCQESKDAQTFYPTTTDSFPKVDLSVRNEASRTDLEISGGSTNFTEILVSNQGPNQAETVVLELFIEDSAVVDLDELAKENLICPAPSAGKINAGPMTEEAKRPYWDGTGEAPKNQPREIKITCEMLEPLGSGETRSISFSFKNSNEPTDGRFHAQVYGSGEEIDFGNNRVSVQPMVSRGEWLDLLADDKKFLTWLSDEVDLPLELKTRLCPGISTRQRFGLGSNGVSSRVIRAAAFDLVDHERTGAEAELVLERLVDYNPDEFSDRANILKHLSETCAIDGAEGRKLRGALRKIYNAITVDIDFFPADVTASEATALVNIDVEISVNGYNQTVLQQIELLGNFNEQTVGRILELEAAGLTTGQAVKLVSIESDLDNRERVISRLRNRYQVSETGEIPSEIFRDNSQLEYQQAQTILGVLQAAELNTYIEQNGVDLYPDWVTDNNGETLKTWLNFLDVYDELLKRSNEVAGGENDTVTVGSLDSPRTPAPFVSSLHLYAWQDLADGRSDKPDSLQLISTTQDLAEERIAEVVDDFLSDPELVRAVALADINQNFANNQLLPGVPKSVNPNIFTTEPKPTLGFQGDPRTYYPNDHVYAIDYSNLQVFGTQLATYGLARNTECPQATKTSNCASLEGSDGFKNIKNDDNLPYQFRDNAAFLAKYDYDKDPIDQRTIIAFLSLSIAAASMVFTGPIILPSVLLALDIADTVLAFRAGATGEALLNVVLVPAFAIGDVRKAAQSLRSFGATKRSEDELIEIIVTPVSFTDESYEALETSGTFIGTTEVFENVNLPGEQGVFKVDGYRTAAITEELIESGMNASKATKTAKSIVARKRSKLSSPTAINAIETTGRIIESHPQKLLPMFNRSTPQTIEQLQDSITKHPNLYDTLLSELSQTELV